MSAHPEVWNQSAKYANERSSHQAFATGDFARTKSVAARHRNDQPGNLDIGWDELRALEHWARICGPTAIDRYVSEFLRHEIARQRPEVWPHWQRMLSRLIHWVINHEMPMARLGLQRFQEMLRQSRNAEDALLEMYYACARLTKDVVEIDWYASNRLQQWILRWLTQKYYSTPHSLWDLCTANRRVDPDLWSLTQSSNLKNLLRLHLSPKEENPSCATLFITRQDRTKPNEIDILNAFGFNLKGKTE